MTSLTSPSIPAAASGRHWLRWIGLLFVSSGLLLPFTLWLAGPERWWTVFIFIPAYLSLGMALIQWRLNGRWSHWNTRTQLALGAIVLTLALILALDLNWEYAWTFMLIVPGLALGLNGYTRAPIDSARFGFGAWVMALGLSIALLGVVFLVRAVGLVAWLDSESGLAWWSAFIALPGLVALACAWLTLRGRGSAAGGSVLMVIALLHLSAATSEFLNGAWYWQLPSMVLGAGVGLLAAALLRARE